MSSAISDLSCWKSASLPSPRLLTGRTVMLEPLNAASHTGDLWRAVQGHDEVWAYLADGPYAREADLREALEEKQAGKAAQFFAIVPQKSGRAEGYASYMRIDTAHGVIEVGNIL